MSKGLGRIERRIGELFATTKDRGLSVGDLAQHAFELPDGVVPNRKQRLSATRAVHRLLQRAAAAKDAVAFIFDQIVAETTAKLGREPGGRGREAVYFSNGHRFVAVDAAFAAAMEATPSWPFRQQTWSALEREQQRFDGVLTDMWGCSWRATETKDGRLWFHPGDFPIRVWAVAIQPQGVVWADTEITGVDNTYVQVRYRGELARLDREKLARNWTIYRNVLFTSARSGYAARSFDQMWWQRYWRPGSSMPPAMQMPLADAIKLLGVPADFSQEDILAAFRRKAFQCHPDQGGTAAQFIELVKARDRLLASIGTSAAAPKMPEFAPKGVQLRYRAWRPTAGARRLGDASGGGRLLG